MIAEIVVKKARQNEIDGFIFVKFRNVLRGDDLPSEYIGDAPCFYSFKVDELSVWETNNLLNQRFYKVNDFICKEDFYRLISILKKAGQRLTDINKIAKHDWVNNKEIVIKI